MKSNWESLSLAKLIKENDTELLIDLNPKLYSGNYRQIFKLIQRYFSDNQKLPSFAALEASVHTHAPKDLLPIVAGILKAVNSTDAKSVSRSEIIRGLKDKFLLATMDSQLHDLTQRSLAKDADGVRATLSNILMDVSSHNTRPTDFAEAMEAPDRAKIITSGIHNLDQYITGYAGLTLISAVSGGGKTAYMLQSAVGQYLAGYNILFVSLELSAQVLGKRLKSFLTGIPFKKIISDGTHDSEGNVINTLSDEERELIRVTMEDFWNRPNSFRVVTNPLDTDELLNLINVEQSLNNLDIAYVDYLNLVDSPADSEGGWRNLAHTARQLHRLSMNIGVITVSAVQVDLEKVPKNGAFPQIRTRGSAELHNSSTVHLFIYRPVSAGEEVADENSGVLYVMKNRNDAMKAIMMDITFSLMRFDIIMEM